MLSLGPILWDLQHQSMSFWRHDHRVQWRGLHAPPQAPLSAHATHGLLDLLLTEFADLFAVPIGLPPPRSLITGAIYCRARRRSSFIRTGIPSSTKT